MAEPHELLIEYGVFDDFTPSDLEANLHHVRHMRPIYAELGWMQEYEHVRIVERAIMLEQARRRAVA